MHEDKDTQPKKQILQVNQDGTTEMVDAPDISNIKPGNVDRFRQGPPPQKQE
jgi:hypothetical protein